MKKTRPGTGFLMKLARSCMAILCSALLVPGETLWAAQSQAKPAAAGQEDANLPPSQLDSLVAPIALYPDPMLAQVLAASTYALELIELQQCLATTEGITSNALAQT